MEKTKIDWCESTWNPVTGCYHECPYCYARGIANRFSGHGEQWNDDKLHVLDNKIYAEESETAEPYPYGFVPTLHRYSLNKYEKKKGRTIFVCSMADLFGSWVPDSWIEEVFAACDKAPQHNYIFLTKNPARYTDLSRKGILRTGENMWYGVSQTGEEELNLIYLEQRVNFFVSAEPLLKPISVILGDWVIIGAETGRRKDKITPKREWIENIVSDCKKYDIPIFMKFSLADIWGEPLIQEFPKQLRR